MPRTRAQVNSSNGEEQETTLGKRDRPEDADDTETKDDQDAVLEEHAEDVEEPPTKSAKKADHDEYSSIENTKLRRLLNDHGSFPLEDTGLKDATKPTAATILAHVLHALLTSTRISHQIAAKTLTKCIEAGYNDLDTLEKSSWQERTEVLTEGGYTHYREKTATELGELAELIREHYDGDLNNLLQSAKEGAKSDEDAATIRWIVRDGISDVKGIGAVALDIFSDTCQGVWHELAPFLDARSKNTAEQIGIPSDVEELYEAVGRDAVVMSKVAVALTTVRLEKLEEEYA